jgi:hypothetical protein
MRWNFPPLAVLLMVCHAANAQQPPIKVEIKLEQATVKNGQCVSVGTTIKNASTDDQHLRIWSCSYPQQWTTDNPAVALKQVPCKENALDDVHLRPGEVYDRNLAVSVFVAAREGLERQITFRLGFSSWDEATVPPIWSNAVTVDLKEP